MTIDTLQYYFIESTVILELEKQQEKNGTYGFWYIYKIPDLNLIGNNE